MNSARWQKLTLLLVSTLTVMSGATISPSLPAMREAFAGVANADLWVRLVLTVPALFIVLGAPVAGVVTDKLGRKPLLVAATVLYGLAGASGFVLDSLWAILVGRALLGLAVGGVMTSVTTLIGDYFEGKERANVLGLQGTFMNLGGILFLTLGGVLADLEWRMPFLIYLFAFVLLPLLLYSLYEPEQVKGDGEAAGLAQLPWGLLSIIYSAGLVFMVIFYTIPVQLPFYLADSFGASGTLTGLAVATASLFGAVSSTLYSRISDQLSYVVILSLSFAFMSLGYAIIGLATSVVFVMTGLAVAGLGLGLILPNLNRWTTESASAKLRGKSVERHHDSDLFGPVSLTTRHAAPRRRHQSGDDVPRFGRGVTRFGGGVRTATGAHPPGGGAGGTLTQASAELGGAETRTFLQLSVHFVARDKENLMALTLGTAPFGSQPAGQFNFTRNGPDPVLYWEDFPKRVRVEFGGKTIADSRRVKALHEAEKMMVLYLPQEDVDMSVLEPSDHTTESPDKGTASYWSVRVGDRRAENAVWSYENPVPSAAPMAGYLAFVYKDMDAWYQEDDRVYAHPRNPYHRFDVHRSSRHVVVRYQGQVVAESHQPALLFETGLPVRYYLPPEDVQTDLLAQSSTVSECPYKGDGQHWHLNVGGDRVEDAAWSLPRPLGEAAQITDYICFYPDKLETEVDGEPLDG